MPSLIVLHYTAMDNPDDALERLCSPEFEVSAHYLVHRDGRLFQLVDDDMRAWHAGAGSWHGREDVNSRSIGVEIDNDGSSPFGEAQLSTLDALLADLMGRWSIPVEGVIGHSDMAPGRKIDPGRRFPWQRLARQGFAVWPNQAERGVDEASFLKLAVQFGYPGEAGYETVLDAMRQRFRPWATGPLDARDMGIMADLAHRFPVDPTILIA